MPKRKQKEEEEYGIWNAKLKVPSSLNPFNAESTTKDEKKTTRKDPRKVHFPLVLVLADIQLMSQSPQQR